MKVVFTITADTSGVCASAGFTVYDQDGRVLVSERSSGRNVAKRTCTDVLHLLQDQAEQVASDCEAESEF
jgi:hypothetical protein